MNFRGESEKNSFTPDSQRYALGFGDKSKFDEKTLEVFGEFKAKQAGKLYKGKEPRPYFSIVQDYNQMV